MKKAVSLFALSTFLLAAAAQAANNVSLSPLLEGAQWGGFIDTSWTNNFNKPQNNTTNARAYDRKGSNFNIHAVEINVQKAPSEEGGVGFRTDLFFGEDAQINASNGTTDDFDLQQAYIDIIPTHLKNVRIMAGKFVTLHGFEVIESVDNWNYTRGLLFLHAIPFTHTGVRASYTPFSMVTLTGGVNNGWDKNNDDNRSKSVEGMLAVAPMKDLTFSAAVMDGVEKGNIDNARRTLLDLVAKWRPISKLALGVNYDYAKSKAGDQAVVDTWWEGVAAYARYEFTNQWALAVRGERFNDPHGVRVSLGTPMKIEGGTVTGEYKPWDNLITRLEFRRDHSNKDSFFTIGSGNRPSYNQNTLGLEAIYTF